MIQQSVADEKNAYSHQRQYSYDMNLQTTYAR